MIKFSFGGPAKVHGVNLDNTLKVNTWAAFAGSDDNAVVGGDFAVTENEQHLSHYAGQASTSSPSTPI